MIKTDLGGGSATAIAPSCWGPKAIIATRPRRRCAINPSVFRKTIALHPRGWPMRLHSAPYHGDRFLRSHATLPPCRVCIGMQPDLTPDMAQALESADEADESLGPNRRRSRSLQTTGFPSIVNGLGRIWGGGPSWMPKRSKSPAGGNLNERLLFRLSARNRPVSFRPALAIRPQSVRPVLGLDRHAVRVAIRR
jgi:hypothetical protein